MNADVTLQGLDEMLGNIAGAPGRILRAAGGALYRRGEVIMADSKEHFVPVDQEILRDSGYVGLPEFVDDGVRVTLGYGGAAEAYAAVQHEDMSLNHPNGGGPKYLERPLLEHGQHLLPDLADDIRADLGIAP